MAELGLSKNQIIAQLVRSEHGELKNYIPVGLSGTQAYPDFMAHLAAWNQRKGQVRDSKIALPLITLLVPKLDEEFVENALALVAMQGPREMLKAYRFLDENRAAGHMAALKRVIKGKLLASERNWPKWERTMLQHRAVLRELFALLHISPADERTDACLFGRKGKTALPYPTGGLFETVAQLKTMKPLEAAGEIIGKRIPFLIASGALGDKAKDPDLVLALIKAMTATELVTNTKALERLGVKTNPMLRGAFQEGLQKAQSSTANVLKATTAAENLDDEDLAADMNKLQQAQTKKFSNVDGSWAVLGDRSPSMATSVEVAKEVAAVLTAMVKGKVWLVYFDSLPQTIDVTGSNLDIIKKATRHIQAGGSGTSIGCGLQSLLERKEIIDGVAIVSDAEENSSPRFADVYKKYSAFAGKDVPVYLYLTEGGTPNLQKSCNDAGIDVQVFDLRKQKMDLYSLPNLVQTMRTNRYSLIDEIMETPLLKLQDAYKEVSKRKGASA